MKDTAPISQGVLAVAALFGLIAAGVALVLFDFHWIGALFIGLIVAVIAAIVLLLGWREPLPGPQGARDLSPSNTNDPEPEVSAPVPAAAEPEPEVAAAAEPEPTPAPEPTPTPVPEVAKEPEASAEPAPEPAPATAEADVQEAQPSFLAAAREGGPDDLKQIKGVGKKLEETLHGMGIFHFDQIATWGPAEQAWMDGNLKGFKGRATRDKWVEQAKVLAEGGTTEFSSKVEKGNVY